MKIFRIIYMLLSFICLAYGITFDSKVMQILGALFTLIVWLWEFFLHEKDSKELKRYMENGDEALNVQRDAEGNVVNNPFDMGEY